MSKSTTTPSKLRRRGREACIPGEDPRDHSPWPKGSWGYDMYLPDFIEGWKAEEKRLEEEERKPKIQDYPETHQEGNIFFEQSIDQGVHFGDLGVQIAGDGRIWICVDGKALIRFTPERYR